MYMGYTGTQIPYSLSELAIVLSSLTQKREKGRSQRQKQQELLLIRQAVTTRTE